MSTFATIGELSSMYVSASSFASNLDPVQGTDRRRAIPVGLVALAPLLIADYA